MSAQTSYLDPANVPYAERTPTTVIFRRWPKSEGGQLIALFPYEYDDYAAYKCSSYMHVGQHASADASAVISRTKAVPLTDQDVIDLTRELEDVIGYRLVPAKVQNARLREKAQYAYRLHLKQTGLVPVTYWPEIKLGPPNSAHEE